MCSISMKLIPVPEVYLSIYRCHDILKFDATFKADDAR